MLYIFSNGFGHRLVWSMAKTYLCYLLSGKTIANFLSTDLGPGFGTGFGMVLDWSGILVNLYYIKLGGLSNTICKE